MFYHLKLMKAFDFDASKYDAIVTQLKELETDEDVLALPPVQAFVDKLDLWLPTELDAKAEIELKRAVISACDTLSGDFTRLDVEVFKSGLRHAIFLLSNRKSLLEPPRRFHHPTLKRSY